MMLLIPNVLVCITGPLGVGENWATGDSLPLLWVDVLIHHVSQVPLARRQQVVGPGHELSVLRPHQIFLLPITPFRVNMHLMILWMVAYMTLRPSGTYCMIAS